MLNHAEVERLAYQFWEERGRPLRSPDIDWCRAEQELYGHQIVKCNKRSLAALHASRDRIGPGGAWREGQRDAEIG